MTHFRMHRAAHFYNLSFRLEPDLLSQWRGYGSSQGVCLEFNDEELNASLDSYTTKCLKTAWTLPKRIPRLEPGTGSFLSSMPLKCNLPWASMWCMNWALQQNWHTVCRLFQEWRFQRRAGVPYGHSLKSIIIGPCSNRSMMMEGISFLLQSKVYNSTHILFTEILFL